MHMMFYVISSIFCNFGRIFNGYFPYIIFGTFQVISFLRVFTDIFTHLFVFVFGSLWVCLLSGLLGFHGFLGHISRVAPVQSSGNYLIIFRKKFLM
jgi:hypothetical protein